MNEKEVTGAAWDLIPFDFVPFAVALVKEAMKIEIETLLNHPALSGVQRSSVVNALSSAGTAELYASRFTDLSPGSPQYQNFVDQLVKALGSDSQYIDYLTDRRMQQ